MTNAGSDDHAAAAAAGGGGGGNSAVDFSNQYSEGRRKKDVAGEVPGLEKNVVLFSHLCHTAAQL